MVCSGSGSGDPNASPWTKIWTWTKQNERLPSYVWKYCYAISAHFLTDNVVKEVTGKVEAIQVCSLTGSFLLVLEDRCRTTRQFLHVRTKKLERKARRKYVNKYEHTRTCLYPLHLRYRSNPKPRRSWPTLQLRMVMSQGNGAIVYFYIGEYSRPHVLLYFRLVFASWEKVDTIWSSLACQSAL